MRWIQKHPLATQGHLGYIPEFLHEDDARPAKDQFNTNYVSGWRPTRVEFRIDNDNNLCYPGDPPLPVLWETKLRDETIQVYAHAWVRIIQPDGTYEIARMD